MPVLSMGKNCMLCTLSVLLLTPNRPEKLGVKEPLK